MNGLLLTDVLPQHLVRVTSSFEVRAKCLNCLLGRKQLNEMSLLPAVVFFFELGKHFEVVLCKLIESVQETWYSSFVFVFEFSWREFDIV